VLYRAPDTIDMRAGFRSEQARIGGRVIVEDKIEVLEEVPARNAPGKHGIESRENGSDQSSQHPIQSVPVGEPTTGRGRMRCAIAQADRATRTHPAAISRVPIIRTGVTASCRKRAPKI